MHGALPDKVQNSAAFHLPGGTHKLGFLCENLEACCRSPSM